MNKTTLFLSSLRDHDDCQCLSVYISDYPNIFITYSPHYHITQRRLSFHGYQWLVKKIYQNTERFALTLTDSNTVLVTHANAVSQDMESVSSQWQRLKRLKTLHQKFTLYSYQLNPVKQNYDLWERKLLMLKPIFYICIEHLDIYIDISI